MTRPPVLDMMFVHVPKAGGSSLLKAMLAEYGAALLRDYSDRQLDPDAPKHRDRAAFLGQDHTAALDCKRAVFGYFWARK